jgi:glycosyltransferase involved in cell wall biosynthesis
VRAIARRLAGRGHAVTVLSTDLELEANRSRLPTLQPDAFGWRAVDEGVEAIYLRTSVRFRLVTFNPVVVAFCQKRLKDFDVVHIYGLYDLIGPAVSFFCRRRGIPYVVEPIGMFRPIARAIWLKRLYHAFLGGSMIRGADRLIVTSDQERAELMEGGLPSAKIVVRRNGVEPPEEVPPRGTFRKAWNIPAKAKVILFLGRLVSKKNPEMLLEAFLRWRNGRDDSAVLVFSGPHEDDRYVSALKALVSRLDPNGPVLFTGPLFDQAKWAAYEDADVFVLPSLNENFGNTAAEAVACGTPVIVTETCGVAPLVNGRAGLVVPVNAAALSQALARLLDDDSLRQRFREGCAGLTRELGWDEPVAIMEQLYSELVPR